MEIEGWSYLDSFYYAYVTVYTIGFGDFVASKFFKKKDTIISILLS